MSYNVKDVAINLLNLFLTAVGVILSLRFVLKLFGANANNGFVDWVYEMSSVLLEPFRGIFGAKVFENQYVLEFSTLFALLVYSIFGLLLIWLITAVTPETDSAPRRKK
jgi:uncharacterized protein YggT (Ycf19 family)